MGKSTRHQRVAWWCVQLGHPFRIKTVRLHCQAAPVIHSLLWQTPTESTCPALPGTKDEAVSSTDAIPARTIHSWNNTQTSATGCRHRETDLRLSRAGARLRGGAAGCWSMKGSGHSSPNPSFRETRVQHSIQSQPAFPPQTLLALHEMMCMNTQSQSIQIHHLSLSNGFRTASNPTHVIFILHWKQFTPIQKFIEIEL